MHASADMLKLSLVTQPMIRVRANRWLYYFSILSDSIWLLQYILTWIYYNIFAESQFQKKSVNRFPTKTEILDFQNSHFHLIWLSWDITSYDIFLQNRSFKKNPSIDFPRKPNILIFRNSYFHLMRHHINNHTITYLTYQY